MAKASTPKKESLYERIKLLMAASPVGLTAMQVADAVGTSMPQAWTVLNTLRAQGLITRYKVDDTWYYR